MKTLSLLFLSFVCVVGEAQAAPSIQHRAEGVVRSIDPKKHLVVIETEAKNEPDEFVVDDQRTRVRRDGTSAALQDLRAGQRVKLYFRKERDHLFATEVTWQTK